MLDNIWNNYGEWLLNYVGFTNMSTRDGRPLVDQYVKLMDHLHNVPFEWKIQLDENRTKDGLALRYDFFDDCGVSGADFERPCCVLEMLIGLALRISDEYIGDPSDEHPELIFWDMICNLGLDQFKNNRFDVSEVDKILYIWMRREFKSDGYGSLFPLKSATFDQRKCEIWSQMMAYLSENF